MGRIFSIIAAIAAMMVLVAGGGSYWFSNAKIKLSEKQVVAASANGLATAISLQLAGLQQSVDAISRSPDVIAAISLADPSAITSLAGKLQLAIPGALKVRLLPPNINETEQTSLPHLGFGDLEMVHSTLTEKQKPVIQGEGVNRHLALTSAISLNDRVIGVVLLSMKEDFIKQAITKTQLPNGFAELKQDDLLLATIGDQSIRKGEPNTIPLNNSRWSISVWAENEIKPADISLMVSIVLLPALLACLVFFIGYRKLKTYLLQDQSSILNAAKDMLNGKSVGNYAIILDEMRPIISSLLQFKRVLKQDGFSMDTAENPDNDMFDESFDLDFLEESPAAGFTKKTIPISMPNFDSDIRLPPDAANSNDKS